MECKRQQNIESCTCPHNSCDKYGLCCDCIRNHLAKQQLPGCCFPPEAEACDHSFKAFVNAWGL